MPDVFLINELSKLCNLSKKLNFSINIYNKYCKLTNQEGQ